MAYPRFYKDLEKSHFIVGAATYTEDAPYTNPEHARIVVNARMGNAPQTFWVVDTGAPWCVVNPWFVDSVGVPYETLYRPIKPMIIRGFEYEGCLIKAPLTLIATWGEDIEIDATFFLPDIEADLEEEQWNLPNFLGLSGCLNHIRYAVEPISKVWYFGLGS